MVGAARQFGVVVAVGLIALAGCRSKKRSEPQPTATESASVPRSHPIATAGTVEGAELERLEQEILDYAIATRTRKCQRPVLRGTSIVDRPADEAIIRVVEAAGPVGACSGVLEQRSSELSHALEQLEFEEFEDRDGRLSEIEEACGAFYEAIAQAVAHGDACSPYLVGRHALPSPLPFFQTRLALAIQARSLAMGGSPTEALRALLDAAQLGRDLARGGANALTTAVGLAWSVYALELAHQVLDHYAQIPAATLDGLAAELDRMLAHPPVDIPAAFEAEYMATAAMLLPALEPDGWQPPDGLLGGHLDTPPAGQESITGDPRHDAALMLLGIGRSRAAWTKACPAGIDLGRCSVALDQQSERSQKLRAEVAQEMEQRYRKLPLSVSESSHTRELVLALFSTMADPAATMTVAALIEARAQLSALRVHIELRRIAEESGRCPTLQDAIGPRIEPLLSPVGLGGALAVKPTAGGGLEIWPPPFARKQKALSEPRCWKQ